MIEYFQRIAYAAQAASRRLLLLGILGATLAACSFHSSSTTKISTDASGAFSDGEILQILATLHRAEIEQAQLARHQSDNRTVRATADRVDEDHRRYATRVTAMTRGAPAENSSEFGRHYALQLDENTDRLARLSGDQFDCAFLKEQVAQHQLAVELVQSKLKPSVQGEALAALLSSLGPALAYHSRAAQKALLTTPQCGAASQAE